LVISWHHPFDSQDGRSHIPEEYSSLVDWVAGIEVLAVALHRLAY
jgi:allantoate deiminase